MSDYKEKQQEAIERKEQEIRDLIKVRPYSVDEIRQSVQLDKMNVEDLLTDMASKLIVEQRDKDHYGIVSTAVTESERNWIRKQIIDYMRAGRKQETDLVSNVKFDPLIVSEVITDMMQKHELESVTERRFGTFRKYLVLTIDVLYAADEARGAWVARKQARSPFHIRNLALVLVPSAAIAIIVVALIFNSSRPLVSEPVPTTATLVAHWRMDEGSGAFVADSASKGADGILNKATWVQGASCKLSSCLSFDPKYGDNYVNIPHYVATPLNLSHFTLSAWIKITDSTQYAQMIINKRPFAGGDYATNFAFGLLPSLNLVAYFGDGSNLYKVRGNASLSPNQWYYVVATFDGSNLSTYVNGHLDSEVAAAGIPFISDANVYIGTYGSGKTTQCENPTAFNPTTELATQVCVPFSGLMNDVRIYNGALSAHEIDAEYLSSAS